MDVGCCGGGGTDGGGGGLLGMWDATDGGNFFQVLGTHSIVHQQLLARGGA